MSLLGALPRMMKPTPPVMTLLIARPQPHRIFGSSTIGCSTSRATLHSTQRYVYRIYFAFLARTNFRVTHLVEAASRCLHIRLDCTLVPSVLWVLTFGNDPSV